MGLYSKQGVLNEKKQRLAFRIITSCQGLMWWFGGGYSMQSAWCCVCCFTWCCDCYCFLEVEFIVVSREESWEEKVNRKSHNTTRTPILFLGFLIQLRVYNVDVFGNTCTITLARYQFSTFISSCFIILNISDRIILVALLYNNSIIWQFQEAGFRIDQDWNLKIFGGPKAFWPF